MAIGDALKDILKQFALTAPQAVSDSLTSRLNPALFQQQQENKRQQAEFQQQTAQQQASLAQQLNLHNTPTPYEKMQIEARNQEYANQLKWHEEQVNSQLATRDENNRKWVAEQTQQGNLRPAKDGDENVFSVGGQKLVTVPIRSVKIPKELQAMFGSEDLPINKEYAPTIDKIFGEYEKNMSKKQANPEGYMKQIDMLYPPNSPNNTKYNTIYRGQINNLLEAGDTKGADALMTKLSDSAREAESKYGADAIKGEANLASAKKNAEDAASYAFTRSHLWDQFPAMFKEIQRGGLSYQDLISRIGPMGKLVFDEYIGKNGGQLPVPLSPAALGQLRSMEPVLDSLQRVKHEISKYKDNSTPMTLLMPRLKYALGIGDEQGGLISAGEMDRLRGAAQSLSGLQTGEHVLDKAQIHTPDFWKDSGKLMNDKVDNMIDYLNNNVDKIYKYGAKTGIVGAGSNAKPKPDVDSNNVLRLTPSDEELLRKLKQMQKKQ